MHFRRTIESEGQEIVQRIAQQLTDHDEVSILM